MDDGAAWKLVIVGNVSPAVVAVHVPEAAPHGEIAGTVLPEIVNG
jgi:hypothetical protein